MTPYNPEFERQMRLAEEIMREDREILRALSLPARSPLAD